MCCDSPANRLTNTRQISAVPQAASDEISSQNTRIGRRTQMRGIKLVPLCFGSLSAIAFTLAVPSATAQELHGHNVCRSVGAFTPEQLGDRDGHALSITESSCQVTEGPTAGAVQDETNVLEWDGPKGERAVSLWRCA
jgi:hypothetical protein